MDYNQLKIDTSDDVYSPVALLFTPDEDYINPIREFLESTHCRVRVNPSHIEDFRYFIVCGDTDYVKTILGTFTENKQNTLTILWSQPSQDDMQFILKRGKAVIINRATPLFHNIQTIFSFYFTSNKKHLTISGPEKLHDLTFPKSTQKSIVQQTPLTRENKQESSVSREPTNSINFLKRIEQDNDRIKKTIESIYTPKNLIKEKIKPPFAKSEPLNHTRYIQEVARDTDRIKKTIESVYKIEPSTSKPRLSTHEKQTGLSLVWPFVFASLIFIAPYIWYGIALLFASVSLTLSMRYIKNGNAHLAETTVNASRYWISQSSSSLFLIQLPFRLLTISSPFASQELTVSFLSDTQEAFATMTQLTASTKQLTKSIFPDLYEPSIRNGSLPVLVDSYRTNLPFVTDRLGLAEAELKKLTTEKIFPFSVPFIGSRGPEIINDIESARDRLNMFQNLLSVYTEAGGFKRKSTYLILFQNSMELRPTGGFIGSLAEVSLLDGEIESYKVYDVYDIDGQLKGHSDPPGPIRSILGQEHWYLRDSNWDPDFTVSGASAAWFYEKSVGRKIDGVVAVNSPFVTDILKATGPVFLSDFNDTVTAENFYGKSLYYIEQSFFPGSTQKKDFLGSLMNALIISFNKPGHSNTYLLGGAVERALSTRNMMFYFKDPDLEHLVRQYGWSGEWMTNDYCVIGSERNPRCFSDMFGDVSANLSLNKVNYFIRKRQESDIRFTDRGEYTVSSKFIYENTSSGKGEDGGGNYRNYERFYIPVDAAVMRVTLDGKDIPVKSENEGIVVLPYQEEGSPSATIKSVAVAYDVPPGTQKTVEVSYTRPVSTLRETDFLYDFYIPKQPGIEASEIAIRISYPPYFTPEIKESGEGNFLAKADSLEYNSVLNKDLHFRIIFKR